MHTEILEGPERHLVDWNTEGSMKLQLALDKMQRAQWIQQLADWQVMATFTFRWRASIWSAQRCFEKMMARRLPGVSYVEAIEAHPGGHGYHVHALWADCAQVNREREFWNWLDRYGRARIEPVKVPGDAAGYASKYLCKDDAWFNVNLQHHWKQRLRGETFSLQTSPSLQANAAARQSPE